MLIGIPILIIAALLIAIGDWRHERNRSAYDAAPSVPISDEEIDRIVDWVVAQDSAGNW